MPGRAALAAAVFVCALLAAAAVVEPADDPPRMWRGLVVAEEDRCAPYDGDLYPYPASVEDDIVQQLGGIYSPYTCEAFESTRETDIEHIVARSEAHDSGMCAADAETRRRFAADLRNLTLAAPGLNRNEKAGKDAAEWSPPENACWFAEAVIDVRRAYDLTIDAREADALDRLLAGCTSTAIACELVDPPVPVPALPFLDWAIDALLGR